jgi:lipid A 3-O-deacylase
LLNIKFLAVELSNITLHNNIQLLNITVVLYFVFQIGYTAEMKAEDGKRYISFSTAVFDIVQKDHTSLEGRLEYRGTEFNWIAKPITGLMANTDGAVYFYSGVVFDIPLFSFLFISPSFAPGIYYKSNSKDLDFLLEFRSQFELGLRLANDIKVGISFNHISNASLGKTNPGVESIAITYHFPF